MHDVMFGGRGNLDHIVSGPNGVYLVETKYRRYSTAEAARSGQAPGERCSTTSSAYG